VRLRVDATGLAGTTDRRTIRRALTLNG